MTSPRICRTCKAPKPLEEFGRAATHLGGDGYRRDCRSCTRASRGSPASGPSEEPVTDEFIVAPSVGYSAHFAGDDLVIVQKSSEGESRIWLSLHEFDQLAGYVAKRLASSVEETPLEPA